MTDTEVTYVEIWVGLAQVTAERGIASPLKRGAKYAHLWCATHAEDQSDFEQRARETLALQGLAVTAFEQVSLAEDMNVIPDELFSLVSKVQQDEQISNQHQQVFTSGLLYLTSNQRPN
jgi:hypothetical protein